MVFLHHRHLRRNLGRVNGLRVKDSSGEEKLDQRRNYEHFQFDIGNLPCPTDHASDKHSIDNGISLPVSGIDPSTTSRFGIPKPQTKPKSIKPRTHRQQSVVYYTRIVITTTLHTTHYAALHRARLPRGYSKRTMSARSGERRILPMDRGALGGGAVREETDATRTEETDRTADRSPPRRTRSHYGDRFIKRKRKEENDASVADRTQLPSTVVRRKSNRNQSKSAIRRRTDQTPQQLGLYRRRDDARRHSQSHFALSRTHRRVGVSIDK